MNDDVRLPQAAPSTSQTSTSKTSFLPTISHQLVNNVHNTFPHQIAAGTSNLNSGANLCLNEAMTVSDQPSCLVSNPSAMPRLSSLQTTAHYFNPLLNLAIHQDAQLDHLLSSQRNFQLLNALLQSSQFPGVSNVQRTTSILLAEQQAREAEAHRLQFFGFNALHTNTVSEPSMMVNNVTSQQTSKESGLSGLSGSSVVEPRRRRVDGLPARPYYPTHFMRGTLLQVSNDKTKMVENLENEDFQGLSDMASLVHQKQMCIGLVIALNELSSRSVEIVFEIKKRENGGDLEISTWSLDTPFEYPFFEIRKRWCSFQPARTESLYGLECLQLEVGDRCFVLSTQNEQSLSSIEEISISESATSSVSAETERASCSHNSHDSHAEAVMDDHVMI